MKYMGIAVTALASMASVASAVVTGVTGAAEGFGAGTTGGGSTKAVYPTTNAQLVSYLGDSSARVIVLTKTFDFRNSVGTTTSSGCMPWGSGAGCQIAINKDNWCKNYQPNAPVKSSITYDAAAGTPINVASNKSLVGDANKGVIIGRGLRIANGAKNVILQNFMVTQLNEQYVWGGDALTIAGSDHVWIDHVTTSKIGRQHIVLGEVASGRVTISNCFIEGQSTWSATCDGHQYWALYFTGANDQITFKNNYIHGTSGRAPKVQGNTILHAVNNYWKDNSGHAFEIGAGGYVLAEGNVFQGVKAVVEASSFKGQLFSAANGASCAASLGRNCQANLLSGSGPISGANTGFLTNFKGKAIASAGAASGVVAYVSAHAGYGKV